jgi:hypothetical protein
MTIGRNVVRKIILVVLKMFVVTYKEKGAWKVGNTGIQ